MPITIEISGESLRDITFSTADLMREIGLLARETIYRRTITGVGVNRPFRSYSPGYARWKTKNLGSASPVNLQVSGQMLNAMQIVEVTDKSVSIGFL